MHNYSEQGLFGNIYEFTEDDLKSNRSGFITAGQKAWLESIAKGLVKSSRRTLPIGLIFALFGICLITALFLQNEETRALLFSSGASLITAFIGVLLFVMVTGILAVFLAKRTGERLQKAELLSAQGVASIQQDSTPNSGLTSYHLRVGDKRLAFGDDPSRLFKQGAAYRVYYCKAGVHELILSFEPVNS